MIYFSMSESSKWHAMLVITDEIKSSLSEIVLKFVIFHEYAKCLREIVKVLINREMSVTKNYAREFIYAK